MAMKLEPLDDAPFSVDHMNGAGPPNDEEVPRVPPNDMDAEAAVLSAVMVDPKAFGKVGDFLRPEHFYSESHRRIYEAAVDLAAKGKPVDVATVATWLRDHDRLAQVGGLPYLTEVLNAAPAVANVRAYGDTVFEKARARTLVNVGRKIAALVQAGTAPQIVVESTLEDLRALPGPSDRRQTPPTLWASDLARSVEPIAFVSKQLTIAPGRPTAFAGEGGTRKGWFAMDLQVCGAAGIELLGRIRLGKEIRSVYLDYEQGQHISRQRFQLLAKGHGIQLAALEQRLGYRWRPVPSWAPKSDADRQRLVDDLCWHTDGLQVAVVDSLRACSFGVDENSVFASGPLDIATAVSEKTGATFVFLDHAGKPDPTLNRGRKHTQRGHSSKLDAGQTLLVFSSTKGEPTLVRCDRAQVVPESEWPEDFQFTLAPANGGLQLQEIVSAPQVKGAFDELKGKILSLVRAERALDSRDAICARITGHSKTDKLQAIAELLKAGKLVQPGGEGNAFHVHSA